MKKFILSLLSAAAVIIVLSSCSKKNDTVSPVAKNYVLVHGAWQAPYVWDAVKTSLINGGNHVTVVELPGHGSDKTAAYTLTLDVYKNKVADVISKIDGPVILVGHSLGGMIISAVAEQMPSKIEKLVYIAAYLPASGQSLFGLAMTDPDSQLGTAGTLIFHDDIGTVDVKQDQIVSAFIQDGSSQVQNLVLQNYASELSIPLTNTVTLTPANFGSVAKVYIKTLQDHVVSPYLQNRMIDAAGVKNTYQLNTSHSPFLSKPDSVAILLTKIGQ